MVITTSNNVRLCAKDIQSEKEKKKGKCDKVQVGENAKQDKIIFDVAENITCVQ